MRTLYKGPSQIITGVLAALTAICIAGMEVTVLGLLAETLLGINFSWGVVVGGGLLVLYTVRGGIKSVTYTDMFQFIILIFCYLIGISFFQNINRFSVKLKFSIQDFYSKEIPFPVPTYLYKAGILKIFQKLFNFFLYFLFLLKHIMHTQLN